MRGGVGPEHLRGAGLGGAAGRGGVQEPGHELFVEGKQTSKRNVAVSAGLRLRLRCPD